MTRPSSFLSILVFGLTSLLCIQAQSGVPQFSYEGYLTDPATGTAKTGQFQARIKIYSSVVATCELYESGAITINASSPDGFFTLRFGESTSGYGEIFTNKTKTCLNSAETTTDVAQALAIELWNGSSYEAMSDLVLFGNVGYAMRSDYLGDKPAADYVSKPSSCTGSQFLKFDGTGFVCSNMSSLSTTANTTVAGNIWYDSSNHNIKFYDGTTTQTLGIQGVITGESITSGTIGGTTGMNTSGNIATTGTLTAGSISVSGAVTANTISTNTESTRNLILRDTSTGTVTLSVPSTVTSYSLKLPAANGSNNQVLATDGTGNLSWVTSASSGITSLNGSTNATQTFATPGTSGTAPNWATAAGNHTLNIPMASTTSVTAGLISKTEYDSFNAKLGTGTSFLGDVSGNYNTLVIGAGVVSNTKLANMPSLTIKANATGAAASPADLPIANLQGTTASTFAAGNDARITGALQSSGGTMTGALILATGTTTLAPLKIPTGFLVTTPVSGNIESDGSDLYYTNSTPARQKLASYTGTPANGQLLIGDGAGFSLANITQGSGISISNSPGGITISATGSGGSVTSVTSANTDISVATGTTTPVLTLNSGTAGGAGDANKIVKLDAGGLLPVGMIPSLDTTKISAGTLPIARGGTNSASALNNNRIMASSGGAIVEAAAITSSRALVSDANGVPTHSTVSSSELGYLSGVTSSIQTQIDGKAAVGSWAINSVIGVNNAGNLTAIAGATSNTMLQWAATGPEWTTASYPSSTTANQLLFSSANDVVNGLASVNNGVLTTNGTGVPSWSALTNDIFTQYALLSGRAGGQYLTGGTAASESLIVDSTSNATKGNIVLNPSGGNVGIGVASPLSKLDVNGSIKFGNDTSGCSPGHAGSQRYNGTAMEFCDGSSWTPYLTTGGGGVSSLNGQTGTAQTFAVGNAGTAPLWSSSANVHTLNLPLASAAGVTAGLISKSDYDTLSSKLGPASTFAGDVSGTASTMSVGKIKGVSVSVTAPTLAGQVLRYDGTSEYKPNFLSLADIRSTVTPAETIFPASPCTADKSLNWSSLTDTLTCQSIGISDSQLTFSTSQTANTFLAAPSGAAGAASFRTIASVDLPVGGYDSTYLKMGGNSMASAVSVGTNDAYPLQFSTNNTTRMTINNTGFVGMGTTTPWTNLSIEATDQSPGIALRNTNSTTAAHHPSLSVLNYYGAYAGGFPKMVLQNMNGQAGTTNPMQTNDNLGVLEFRGSFANGNGSGTGAQIYAVVDTAWSGTSAPTRLHFATASGGPTPVDRMVIGSNGNIGIGTSAPVATLDINGTVRLAKHAFPPNACDSTVDGQIALTSQYTTCVCKGSTTTWVSTSDGTTSCSW